jgi:hypothetical protein
MIDDGAFLHRFTGNTEGASRTTGLHAHKRQTPGICHYFTEAAALMTAASCDTR